ncbi:amidase [Bordetella bronchiseptica]|uniref:amidase n=1 Tax=Bordetella bronchiseptica TaxID=518 RepID=UPI000444E6A5|nr:amidase [Bordetella bronchiseptica]BAO67832.1 amidase [Bordetella bronchiseptica]
MTPAGLPDSIAGLRAQLAAGALDVAQALALQRQACEADGWHCVVALPDDAGEPPPASLPLAGVGLAHKDIFVLPGRVPECGARHPWPDAPVRAATVIRRLAAAGSRPLAALVMAEHASGATGENPRYPLPRNPLDADAAVGGSSSGSAVAVAAGLCYGSLGTDTAGSVRIPAATCGVVGLMPTRGLLPGDGVAPLAGELDTVGVLARCADDAQAVLHAALDAAQAAALDASATPAMERWRIATCWIHPDPAVRLDPAVHAALEDYATECSARGRRREARLAALPQWIRLAQTLLYAGSAAAHAQALRGQAPALGALARNLALTGAAMPPAWAHAALAQRRAQVDAFVAEALADSDVLLTPALPGPVPDWSQVLTSSPGFEARRLLDLFCWLSFVNYLGLPAIVFPVGRDAAGRPISVQAIARPGGEAMLLALARQAGHSRFGGRGFAQQPGLPLARSRERV